MQKPPSVAVVIPAYNEASTIRTCVQSCLDQAIPFDEVIIVNNNSSDETQSILEDMKQTNPQLILLDQNEYQGLVLTRNMGLDMAKSDIIGRIDADAILEPGWVEAVKRTFLDESISAASGPVLYHDMPLPKVGLAVDEKIRSTLHKMAKNHRFLFGTNMAIRRTAWLDIKDKVLPDPDDRHHEDISLALTLYQNDHEITYSPDMVAGMSARRIEDKPFEFYKYVMFTYKKRLCDYHRYIFIRVFNQG